jgi:hypothetical protein
MASKDLICGGVLGERCVVHGAFDRSTFGCAVIVLNPALNRNPSPALSPRYMASKDLTCGGVLGERCVVHGALTDLPSGALSSCLTPLQTETPSTSESKVYGQARI